MNKDEEQTKCLPNFIDFDIVWISNSIFPGEQRFDQEFT
jgi:hypothetical protein